MVPQNKNRNITKKNKYLKNINTSNSYNICKNK